AEDGAFGVDLANLVLQCLVAMLASLLDRPAVNAFQHGGLRVLLPPRGRPGRGFLPSALPRQCQHLLDLPSVRLVVLDLLGSVTFCGDAGVAASGESTRCRDQENCQCLCYRPSGSDAHWRPFDAGRLREIHHKTKSARSARAWTSPIDPGGQR